MDQRVPAPRYRVDFGDSRPSHPRYVSPLTDLLPQLKPLTLGAPNDAGSLSAQLHRLIDGVLTRHQTEAKYRVRVDLRAASVLVVDEIDDEIVYARAVITPVGQAALDTVPAADLTPGQHVMELARPSDDDLTVSRVEHVTGFRVGEDERVAVTLTAVATGLPWMADFLADEPVPLASPEQVAEAGAGQRREELAVQLRASADQLHRLADDVLCLRLPVPRWLGDVVEVSIGIAESRTDLERWAAYAGASVRVNSAVDKIPAFKAARGPLSIRMQSDAEPEPVEFLTPEQWQERTGIRVLDRDGWSDGKPWTDPIWYPEWQRRMSASTVEQRTAAGVLEARLPEPFNAVLGESEQMAKPWTCPYCPFATDDTDAGLAHIQAREQGKGCITATGSDGDQ